VIFGTKSGEIPTLLCVQKKKIIRVNTDAFCPIKYGVSLAAELERLADWVNQARIFDSGFFFG
jgi:hypothetical protein